MNEIRTAQDNRTEDWEELSKAAIEQVKHWLTISDGIPAHRSAKQLAGVLDDPLGLDFTVSFIDLVIRPEDAKIAAENFYHLRNIIPSFLPWYLRSAIKLGAHAGRVAPGVVMPIVRKALREMVGHLIIDARPKKLVKKLRAISAEPNIQLNINLLGEAVLGVREANKRIAGTLQLLDLPEVDYVSLKVSAINPPQAPWSFNESVVNAKEKLRPVFRKAKSFTKPKFINLDMEEYHDLHLTVAVFTELLDEPEFAQSEAGIVLQAYLPDSLGAMEHLQEWAAKRVANGGSQIKVRLVKGANLPMEQTEASLHEWPLATYHTKQDSDTNYKRVLDYALTPERTRNIRLGIAGHNLFDVAFAWKLAQKRGVIDHVEFEMLIGMAESQAKAVKDDVGSLLLYTPVVHPREFDVAIAYLIRRLEEGASEQNFMSAVFSLSKNPELFEREKNRFLNSIRAYDPSVPPKIHRVQDRTAPVPVEDRDALSYEFHNEPDSDPATLGNIAWSREIYENAKNTKAGAELADNSWVKDEKELDKLISTLRAGSTSWAALTPAERASFIHKTGDILTAKRGYFIEVMMNEAGKTFDQADPEVSEAIDFCHFYANNSLELTQVDGAKFAPDSLVLVASPWNFPTAIPLGSTVSALSTGSSVILKPAPATARCAAVLIEALWEAGVPKDVVTLLQVDEKSLGEQLISHSGVDRIILTGAYETAALFKKFREDVPILAETSGKNSIIVTPHADYDLAAKDIAFSAFSHAGQKCSAASLAILVGSVATSERFKNQLLDAVSSLTVGLPGDPRTNMGPLIEAASGKLLDGLTNLQPGEHWLIKPNKLDIEGKQWSPGVKIGVSEGSSFHKTELFGPVLGIMVAKDLDEAIRLQNGVDYGLTAGLQSLNQEEKIKWINSVKAGNIYINRGITGAIVRRQPFGGWKKSAVGAGAKAGGPNYLLGFGTWHRQTAKNSGNIHPAIQELLNLGTDQQFLTRAFNSDSEAWETHYRHARDVSALDAEQNIFRYVPTEVVIRIMSDGNIDDAIRVLGAGIRAGVNPSISTALPLPQPLVSWAARANIPIVNSTDELWLEAIAQSNAYQNNAHRVRVIGTVPRDAKVRLKPEIALYEHEVTESGRIEILHFLLEQAVSVTAHRFGNPITRVSL